MDHNRTVASLMPNEGGTMLVVSTKDGMPKALEAIQSAAKAFADGAGNAKTQWEIQNEDVT